MTALSKEMQEYTESDEELVAMRDSFSRRNTDAQDVVKEKFARRKQLAEKLSQVREELARRTADMGGLEEAKRANERNLVRREEVVKEVARRHGFHEMEVIIEDSQIDQVKAMLQQSLKEEKGNLDKIKV
jgi:hypothetical protein